MPFSQRSLRFLSPIALSLVLVSAAAAAESSSLAEERARQAAQFAALDRDGDGQLADEISPYQRTWMILSDRDGDGAIDLDEYVAFLNQPGGTFDAPLPDNVELIADIPYAGTDHHRQQLDLLLPRERATEAPLPVIAYVHGGGWSLGSRLMARPQVAPHVDSGRYAAVAIGYRLSGEVSYPAQIHDANAGIRWIHANAGRYGLDPDRICAMGSSAGGHLTALLGTTNGSAEHAGSLGPSPELSSDVQCAVDLFGPTDLTVPDSEERRAASAGAPSSREMLLGAPVSEVPELARSASPLHQVDAGDPPFLLIHGTKDPLVAYSDSVALDAALRKAGVHSELMTIEGGGHGDFFGPPIVTRVRAFLDRHLAGSQ